uniref:WH1 domain-containing protein n=1 Tax=Strongyloides papillosus TaxID=174720 RepID=A0A0N5BVU7_STREA
MDENIANNILWHHENVKIMRAMGPNIQLLAFGIGEILQPDFHLGTWTFIQSGVVCYVKDCLKKTYYLNVYNFSDESEDTKLLLNMEISKRLMVCMKTPNFITFCDSLDKNDYVGANFIDADEAKEFFDNCCEIQKRRASKFKFLKSRNNSAVSLGSQGPDVCQLLSSSSSLSSGSLNDQISKFKKLWNINPLRLFKKKAFSKCDSFTVTPNSSFKEEIDDFKDRIVKANSSEEEIVNIYGKELSPLPIPIKSSTFENISRRGTIRNSAKVSRKLTRNTKSLLNARNSIKVNKNKIHQRSTLGSIKTLKIQKKASNSLKTIEKEENCTLKNTYNSQFMDSFSTNIPEAPPLPPELDLSNTKTNISKINKKMPSKIKLYSTDQPIPENLISEIKSMSIGNLKKVEKRERNLLNTGISENLSVMEVLRKSMPIRRNAFEPEESDDDVDSAWSSSNYHSDSDF